MSHAKHHHSGDHQPNLCAHCRNIFENWSEGFGNKDVHFPHYQDPSQLEQSAKNGCSLCAQFTQGGAWELEEIRERLQSRAPEKFHAYVVIDDGIRRNRRGRLQTPENINLKMTYESLTKKDIDNTVYAGFNFDTLAVDLIPATSPEVSTITHTRDALGAVSRWLEICRNSHQRCNVREDFTPTRLVSTEEGNIRLFVASDFANVPNYATLSHCWGKMQITCLEAGSLESFKNSIPSTALCQTFLDAIEIARELGFLYIWIDSLCIMQDDVDDWMRESGLMSSVYGQSGLNIAAAHGRDGNAGCFAERLATWRCRVQVEAKGEITQYDCVPQNMYRKGLADMPLAERGWVLQERVLPTRTVHFTSRELFWECQEKIACETFPDELPEKLAETQGYPVKKPLSRSMWDWVIDTYTHMHLTFTKDKLAAISGLARAIQSQTGDQYVAGMWRKDLEFQLCWTAGGFTEREGRAVPYRAPSWSWVSMEGAISSSVSDDWTEEEEDAKLWIRIQDVQLEFVGPDPLGLLSNAVLTVDTTCLLRIKFQQSKHYENSMMVGREMVRITVHFDCFVTIDDYNAARDSKDQTFVMPVFEWFYQPKGRLTGLVLEPNDSVPGQYRRVGVFYTDKGDMMSIFRKAVTNPVCRARSTDVVRTWSDSDRIVHHIIDLV